MPPSNGRKEFSDVVKLKTSKQGSCPVKVVYESLVGDVTVEVIDWYSLRKGS